MTAASSHPEPSDTDRASETDVWVAIMEFAPNPARLLDSDDVDCLVDELVLWRPSALWSPERYAIQLWVPARGPHQALRSALDYHREAIDIVGWPPSVLLRVEVLTPEAMEAAWEDPEDPARPSTSANGNLHCRELYAATRALLVATTPLQVTEIVDGFVHAIGAGVEPGGPRHLPEMIDIDLVSDGGPARHATAEEMSVAGLLLEQALPNLLSDARSARRRIQQRSSTNAAS